MLDLRELTRRFPQHGVVEAIWLRPQRDVPAIAVQLAEAVRDRGLIGDHGAARPSRQDGGSRRQVTLLQSEHVPLIAAWSGLARLDAGVLRRNLVVSGINLLAGRSLFADRVLHVLIGDAVVVTITGDCSPCSKMEAALGPGGYNALRGHGGVTARVVLGGIARVGDPVRIVLEAAVGSHTG